MASNDNSADLFPLVSPQKHLVPRKEYGEPYTGVDCTIFDASALKPTARDYGRMPDVASWRPADVILFCSYGNVTAITEIVRRVQRQRGFDRFHSRWTHAALYIGGGKFIHVTRDDEDLENRVGVKDVSSFVKQAHYRVRSPRTLSDDARADIVDFAISLVNNKTYSTMKAVASALESFRLLDERFVTSRELFDGIVCSDVVSQSYDHVIPGFPVFATATHQAALPATLSESGFLADIDIAWCRIPASARSAASG